MRLSALFLVVHRVLLLPAVIATVYLYLYPAAHGCAFPDATPANKTGQHASPKTAPFRLLALGDPQLEGDTSLPDPDALVFPSLRVLVERVQHGDFRGIQDAAEDFFLRDFAKLLHGYRKRVDLWGNDLYLAHIYRSVKWWTRPTHTVVLGDLLGSQWIGDEEFGRRSERFWNTVFKDGEGVPNEVMDAKERTEVLLEDGSWERRIIALAGNHDIGYAGDINEHRIERFEDAFGRVNWVIRFQLEGDWSHLGPGAGMDRAPELHLIMFNSMNVDDPVLKPHLQAKTREFLAEQLHAEYTTSTRAPLGTIFLTHIPLHKEEGICVDAPYFSYFPPDQGGGIREQNHLTKETSTIILDGLTSSWHHTAIVLNGHDHEGCDTYHYGEIVDDLPDEHFEEGDLPWKAKQFSASAPERANQSLVGLREITVRSMMGSYHGNAGLLSAWFDDDAMEWKYEYSVCVLGVQHIWWAVHVLDLVVVGLGLASLAMSFLEPFAGSRGENSEKKMKKA